MSFVFVRMCLCLSISYPLTTWFQWKANLPGITYTTACLQDIEDHSRKRRAFTRLRRATRLSAAHRSWHRWKLRKALRRLRAVAAGDLGPLRPLTSPVQIHAAFKWIALCGPSPPLYTWHHTMPTATVCAMVEPMDDLADIIRNLAQSSAMLSGGAKVVTGAKG